MNIDDEIDTCASQAWHDSRSAFDEAWEAYLRKHTFNGQMRELHDAWVALGQTIVRELAPLWLKILDTLGI